MTESLTLAELNSQIKEFLESRFEAPLWVVAEINQLQINRRGHCYLELVQKDPLSERIVARARGTVWAYTFRMLKPYFESVTGQELTQGLKVMLRVSVAFHELYSLSLNVNDINPEFTLGDLARQRNEIMQRLEEEGIMEMNQQLHLPVPPQRFAIISSPTAAGYGDFINQLDNNPHGFQFHYSLFQATMQGESAAQSIVEALEQIYTQEQNFDFVVLIRGGGSKSDLACFDTYLAAANVAQFPLPVITGIGHERDNSIVDIVAHKALKTPTAVAEFLIEQMIDFENYIQKIYLHFTSVVSEKITQEQKRFESLSRNFAPAVRQILEQKRSDLQNFDYQNRYLSRGLLNNKRQHLTNITEKFNLQLRQKNQNLREKLNFFALRLKKASQNYFLQKNRQIAYLEAQNKALAPQNILARGYAMLKKQGKIVKTITKMQKGDAIEIELNDGFAKSQIITTKTKKTAQ